MLAAEPVMPDTAEAASPVAEAPAAMTEPVAPGVVAAAAPEAVITRLVTVAPAPAPAPAPAAAAVEVTAVAAAFVLPLDTLQQVAEGSGLQWVNSDREKIAAAQAAMAAEPAPVRVPRERKPVVLSDTGPLVLVETQKDLSQLKLPFETAGSAIPRT
jgi:ribonuclease E